MTTHRLDVSDGTIAFDDDGNDGPLTVMLPGAGDIRTEYRFLAPELAARGARIVTMDLRGHGESSPSWPAYGMSDTASDLVALLDHLDGGPATVVTTSFAPAAALWAAADRPELFRHLVLISPHVHAAPPWQSIPLRWLLRAPFAGRMWAGQFRKWHPAAPPADLEEHIAALVSMLGDPERRKAVSETLTTHRKGLAERMQRVAVPTLVVMGGADSHFPDPAAEGRSIADETGGRLHVVPDAGHYPHVEFPGQVATAIADFLAETA